MADLASRQARPVTVVTGGSEGIGLELARRFARAGHEIALVARRPEVLAAAAGQLRLSGAAVIEIVLDVCAPGAPDTLEAALAARRCYIDVLVNNAGVGLAAALADQPQVEIDRQIAVNIVALTRLMRHVLPAMLARRRGGILNVASLGGFMPGPYQSVYYASKAYVVSLSEAVAWEVSGSGVTVSALAPGPVETRFHARMGAEQAPYRLLLPSMSPQRAANAGYWGFRLGRRVIVPGPLWSLTALASRLVPHMLLIPVIGWLMRPGPGDARPAGGENAGGKDAG